MFIDTQIKYFENYIEFCKGKKRICFKCIKLFYETLFDTIYKKVQGKVLTSMKLKIYISLLKLQLKKLLNKKKKNPTL